MNKKLALSLIPLLAVAIVPIAFLVIRSTDSYNQQQTASDLLDSDPGTPSTPLGLQEETLVQPEVNDLLEPEEELEYIADLSKAIYNTSTGSFDCVVSNCFYAAVDKQHSLPSSYYPNVVSIPGYSGQLIPQARDALVTMMADMKSAGINVEVTSAFRSYSTQSSTFNNWVNIIKGRNPGISQAAAEAEANTFSALPGQSEHQLGTTADLNTVGAEAFDKDQNATLYKFIEDAAHLYGFVITYPVGQEALTGYVHEPWHVRYIGVSLATELFNTGYTTGNGNFSTQFLRYKGLSD